MRPVTTIARAMEVITEELWIIAVNIAPRRTRRIGLLIPARNFLTPSRAANDSIDPLISSRPTKRSPKPARMPPSVLVPLFLANNPMKAPKPANAENITLVETEFPPNIPRATICAVTVVPIFAP